MQFRLVLLLVVTVLLTLAPALAANPGHPASSVSSGTFESGNYTFPDSMFVMNYVGIGTSSPTQLLDINGSVNVSSASGILYVPQICLAGDCISSWSGVSTSESEVEGWIFDSDNTGTLNTTGNIIATNITGSGLLTIGSIDTGQGSNELYAMNQDVKTTDGVNFASVSTTGAITADGKVTGSNLIDDGTNLVLGSFVNNSAASSTFIGSGSTGQHNTGTYVTAVGLASAYSNSGSSTTFVGDGAGSNNAADYVTAIGAGAGQGNYGEYAISVGLASGGSNTGNRTILIGYQAGDSNSGSDVIAFGYQAGVSNTLANRFIVQQNNINTTPLLYGDFLNNRLGIGNSDTTPDYTLDVAGTINADTQLCIGGDCISAWSSISGTSTNLTVAGDSGSTEFTDGDTLTLDGQNSIVTAVSGSTATIDVVDDSINGSELADTIALDANLSFSQGTYDVNFDSNTLFIDGSANRVAVGTTSPAYSFHVFGTGIISQNTGGASVIRTDRTDGKIAALVSASSSSLFAFDETGDFSIQSYSRSTIEGTSFTSPSLFVLKGSSDFIGVNTSNPSYTFDVAGTINAGNQLCIGAACISSWADVNTSVPDESSIEGYIFDTDNTFSGNFSLNTNDLFLDSSKGYLGIGTTVPSQQLEVSNSTQSFTFNPGGYNNSPQINTTVGTDLVLSSGSGNVVIVIG